MTVRSPSALALSATLHFAVIMVFVIMAYMFKDEAVQASKEFILVAGEGNNYGATEAPALGTPGGVKVAFQPPAAPAPQPPVAAAAPEPEPVAPPAPSPLAPPPMIAAEPPPTATSANAPKTPDFAARMKRTEERTKNKVVAKFAAEQKKKADAEAREAKAAELERRKLSYEEFVKQQGPKSSTSTPANTPRIDAAGIAKGVMGGSTSNTTGGAGGKALSTEEGDLLGKYFALLKQSLQQAHEKPMGVSDLLSAIAEFYVGPDGSLSRVRIARSSGNAEFDQSVVAAFRSVRSIGPRPDHQGSTVKVEFRMKDDD